MHLKMAQLKPVCVIALILPHQAFVPRPMLKLSWLINQIRLYSGGCFWSIQAIYQKLKGVTNVAVGYSGGTKANPNYEDVSTGNTGYTESAQVVYNPNEIKLVDIFKVFFRIHNPTTLDKQGADEGTQYRSAIFCNSDYQKNVAVKVIIHCKKIMCLIKQL